LDILSGEGGHAVYFSYKPKPFKQKPYLKAFVSVLLCVFFQVIYAECAKIENVGSCERAEIAKEGPNFKEILPFDHFSTNHPENLGSEAQLFVFVSNSMPAQSLRQWSEQVDRVGGTLVLRGFIDDSPVGTVEWVKTLLGEGETSGFSIDPERFEQMNIDKVPAVVVVPATPSICEQEECPKPMFGVVYGDVPLDEALSVIANRNPGIKAEAALSFLDRYRDQP